MDEDDVESDAGEEGEGARSRASPSPPPVTTPGGELTSDIKEDAKNKGHHDLFNNVESGWDPYKSTCFPDIQAP